MNGFQVALGPQRLGAEVLVQIAQQRGSGTLLWSTSGVEVRLLFCEGRAEIAVYGQGQRMAEREPVVGVLRGFATTMEGGCQFDPGDCPESLLRIDTLGEVLVALIAGLRKRQLESIWNARAGFEIEPSATFDRVAGALGKLGAPLLKPPLPHSTVGTVIAGADEASQRAWAALIALGAVHAKEPAPSKTAPPPSSSSCSSPANARLQQAAEQRVRRITGEHAVIAPLEDSEPLPADPEQRDLGREVLAASLKMSGTHYEVLGVDAKASADTIRKAYFDHAKLWHSDRFAGTELSDSIVEKAAELFRHAEQAHRLLSDPEERKSYDYILDRQARGLPTEPRVIFEAENLFRKAETLVRRGQGKAAVPLLREAVVLNKGEPDFWVYLGWAVYCADGSKGLKEAREHIHTGLGLREKSDVAHEFLGRMAHQEGQLAEAERELKQALTENRKNVEAQRELRLLQMRRDKAKAESEQKGLGGLLSKVLKR